MLQKKVSFFVIITTLNNKGFKMNAKKIRSVCRPIRLIAGTALVAYAVYSGNNWFYLGLIPLIAGIINLCPICKITKQCDLTGGK